MTFDIVFASHRTRRIALVAMATRTLVDLNLMNINKNKKQTITLPILRDVYGGRFVDIRKMQPTTGICTFDDGFNSTGAFFFFTTSKTNKKILHHHHLPLFKNIPPPFRATQTA